MKSRPVFESHFKQSEMFLVYFFPLSFLFVVQTCVIFLFLLLLIILHINKGINANRFVLWISFKNAIEFLVYMCYFLMCEMKKRKTKFVVVLNRQFSHLIYCFMDVYLDFLCIIVCVVARAITACGESSQYLISTFYMYTEPVSRQSHLWCEQN